MPLVSVVLVLLSAAVHVGWNLLAKSSTNPKAFSLLIGTLIVALTVLLLPFLPISLIPVEVWVCIVASGVIHSIYIWALSTAYETGDISFVYPIMRSAPAIVPIAAFFIIGETVSSRGAAGIAIVIVCVFLIQLRRDPGSEINRLWISLKQKDSIWAFIALAAVVGYTLVDKTGMVVFHGVSQIAHGLHGPVYFLLENTIWALIFSIYMGVRHRHEIRPVWRREWVRGLAAMLGMMASYSLILHVMQTDTVSYIVTLRQSSVLLAVLAGRIFLKEHYILRRSMAAGFMLLGFFLVATAG